MASDTNLTETRAAAPAGIGEKTVFKILLTISFCHLLNDTIQSLMAPIYPLLQRTFHFNYWQVGRIALTSQLTASILQPLVGLYTDRRPKHYSRCRGARGHRLRRVSPRVLPHRAVGLRRTARYGPIAIPGGRQRRFRTGSVAG